MQLRIPSRLWIAIAALVPGRTESQCWDRRHHVLDPSIDRANMRTCKWTEDESNKLQDTVETHGGKNWDKIAALAPGRTGSQCRGRWRDALDPRANRTPGRTDEWTAVEDDKLKDAAQIHGEKGWHKIAAPVQGRSKKQCHNRWHKALDSNIDLVNICTGKWAEDEDSKLKDAVQTYGGKNWVSTSALVPGRTRDQCRGRWLDVLDPKIDRTVQWTAVDDIKLKDAVQKHGGKNWAAIAALVPGRAKKQCNNRWYSVLDP
jgi:myb proto-oncogene protein